MSINLIKLRGDLKRAIEAGETNEELVEMSGAYAFSMSDLFDLMRELFAERSVLAAIVEEIPQGKETITYLDTTDPDRSQRIIEAFRLVDPEVTSDMQDYGCHITVHDNELTRAIAKHFDLES